MGAGTCIQITSLIFLLLLSPDELLVTSRSFVHAHEFYCAVSSRRHHKQLLKLHSRCGLPRVSWKTLEAVQDLFWPSAPLMAKAAVRICLSKRSAHRWLDRDVPPIRPRVSLVDGQEAGATWWSSFPADRYQGVLTRVYTEYLKCMTALLSIHACTI